MTTTEPIRTEPSTPSCCGQHPHPQHLHSHPVGSTSTEPAPAAKYFCPMCPEVTSDESGACPKCGMALERNPAWKPKRQAKVKYTCPMHPEVVQDHPGSFPICGMALEPATIAGADEGDDSTEFRDLSRRFRWGALLTLPVFVVAMAHLVPTWRHAEWVAGDFSRWTQFLLTTPVVVWAGRPFFARGWQSLRHRSLNMFTLIALGVGVSYLFSALAMLVPHVFPAGSGHAGKPPLYFEAAAVVTVLALLGQVLELRARHQTGNALKALVGLAPKMARRVTAGDDQEIAVEEVQVGDLLRVRPGEKVPVDGVIVEGHTAVDESMLSGESMPVEKGIGATISGGTLNTSGGVVMRAERVGGETMLARIVDLVVRAQRSRAPIQATVDQVSRWFVPAVLGMAVAAFAAWMVWGPEPRWAYALTNAVAVLIIACPCALGLATPMSIMVGVGRGATAGVLIRDAAAIEKLARLRALAVDKTGTLTEGKPRVARVLTADGFSRTEVLSTAAALERSSEHPVAQAILAAARGEGVPISAAVKFAAHTAAGVSGEVQTRRVLVGKAEFLRGNGVSGLEPLEARALEAQATGAIGILVSIAGRAAGLLVLEDAVKSTTPQALAELESLGVRVVMLTGDHPRTAEAVARRLGIKEYRAGMTPQEKHDEVVALRRGGEMVGMAGDGINDAPALAAADVGIAMGTGVDVAIDASDVTLVKGDLRGMVRAIRLGRATMANIRQNLFFAFVYNALGVPIAAGLLYPALGVLMSPMIAGVAMSLSSVSVIANALRLRWARLDA